MAIFNQLIPGAKKSNVMFYGEKLKNLYSILVEKSYFEFPHEGVWSGELTVFATEDYISNLGAYKINDVVYVELPKISDSTTPALKCKILNIQLLENGKRVKYSVAGGDYTLGLPPTNSANLNNVTGLQVLQTILEDEDFLIVDDFGALATISTYYFKHYEVLNTVPKGIQISNLLKNFEGFTWRIDGDGSIVIVNTTARDSFNDSDNPLGKIVFPKHYSLEQSLFDGSVVCKGLSKAPEPQLTAAEVTQKLVNNDISLSIPNAFLNPENLLGLWFDRNSTTNLSSEIIDSEISSLSFRVKEYSLSIDSSYITITLRKESLAELISKTNYYTNKIDSQSTYTAVVDGQNPDGPYISTAGGTLQITPDDPRLKGGGLNYVPIKCNFPGLLLTVPAGTRCTISFENDDISKPFVCGFDQYLSTEMSKSYLWTIGNPSSAQFLALSNKVDEAIDALEAKLNDLITKYNSHVHPGVTAGGASTSATLTVETPVASSDSTACTKIKSV